MKLKNRILIFAFTCGLYMYASRLAFSQAAAPDSVNGKVSLIFTGDIMGHGAQISSAYDAATGTYQYDSCFLFLEPYLKAADFAIGNLEVTLAGPPYKGYPQFSSPDGLAVALKNVGFDVLVTANNHAADRAYSGARRTLQVLDSLGFIHTGTFLSAAIRDSLSPLILEKNGIRIGLLNYSYGINGLPQPTPAVVSLIDTSRMKTEILKCKTAGVDFIIAELHWGTEYERVPNRSQKNLTGWLFSQGVGAIIGSHPHVIQPIDMAYKKDSVSPGRPVVWSMGNLVSNQPERYRNGGLMVQIELQKDSVVHLSKLEWVPVFVYRRLTQGSRDFFILPAGDYLRGMVDFPVQAVELQLMKQFYEDTQVHMGTVPEGSLIPWR